ncbi:MAG: T9SS C-terminal target domain-containing protein [Crocinitomicaceae bacterium]|nr:T9SS C-terminal target domain-containing protein [Crocinitomicaceae bacterium]
MKQGQADYAANICDIFSGNGQKDWFLPSEKEMKKVFSAKDSIGGFKVNKNYWTSNETDLSTAISKSFTDGSVTSINKFDSLFVRLVRRQIDKPASLYALILPGLKLYPNPFTSIFTIDWEANNEKVQIDVLNMDGKVVISDVFFGNSNANIDLTTFPDGVYNVSIQTSKGSIHRRIVKLN